MIGRALLGTVCLVLLASGCDRPLDVVARLAEQQSCETTHCGTLNLEVWHPGDPSAGKEYRLAARITNWGEQPVALGRLALRVWVHEPGEELEPASYANNQSIYDARGQWQANLSATQVTIVALPGVRDCGEGRLASQEATIAFVDELAIAAGGGYLDSNNGTNPLATWHRRDFAPLDPGDDYSRVGDAGSGPGGRADLPQFALYLDGALVVEVTAPGRLDARTGRPPCP